MITKEEAIEILSWPMGYVGANPHYKLHSINLVVELLKSLPAEPVKTNTCTYVLMAKGKAYSSQNCEICGQGPSTMGQ